MKFRWSLATPQPLFAGQLANELRIPPLLAQCLLNRGLNEPVALNAFLQPRLKTLADPFLLPNMEAAVQRLLEARTRQEPLVIFGDYDVDGVTSTALLIEVLRPLGWRSEEHTSELQSRQYLVCRLLLEKKKNLKTTSTFSTSNTSNRQNIPLKSRTN